MNCKWYFVASSRKSEGDIAVYDYSSGVKVCGVPREEGVKGLRFAMYIDSPSRYR